jgi:hypothetical protein
MKSTAGRPPNPQRSLLMQPLGRTEDEIQHLSTFLQALTGDV